MDSMVSGEGYAGAEGGILPVRIFMLFIWSFFVYFKVIVYFYFISYFLYNFECYLL